MTSFVARNSRQIFRDLVAKVTSNLGALNIDEGGPETAILGAVAEEMALHESRLGALVEAHGLDASGSDLDDVVRQIMSGQAIVRGEATAAAGTGIQLTRASSTGVLIIPAGSVFYRSDDPRMRYITTEERSFGDGQTVYPGPADNPIRVTCLTRGAAGNARTGTITGLETFPNGVVAVTNTAPLGGGTDAELNLSLRIRARLLLSSIAKCQPAALQFLGGRWIAADGSSVLHASVYESVDMPAYSELLLDPDGEGTAPTRSATTYGGTVPPSGSSYLPFDGPAATDPLVTINGGPLVPASSLAGAVVIYERGRIEFTEGYGLNSGDTYTVGGHLVYTGAIAEVQRALEGDTFASSVTDYGWRACGTRVRCRPPLVTEIAVSLRIEWASDVVPSEGEVVVRDRVVEFFRAIGIGESFKPFDLYVELGKMTEVEDAIVLSPTGNARPLTRRHRVSTSENLIDFA